MNNSNSSIINSIIFAIQKKLSELNEQEIANTTFYTSNEYSFSGTKEQVRFLLYLLPSSNGRMAKTLSESYFLYECYSVYQFDCDDRFKRGLKPLTGAGYFSKIVNRVWNSYKSNKNENKDIKFTQKPLSNVIYTSFSKVVEELVA